MVLTADNAKRRQRTADIRIDLATANRKFIAKQAVDSIEVGDELHAHDGNARKAITDVSVANPTVVTCVGHGLVTGDQVLIEENASTPALNGAHIVTRVDDDTFTVPVNVTDDGAGDGAGYFFKGTPNLKTLLARGQAAPATDV